MNTKSTAHHSARWITAGLTALVATVAFFLFSRYRLPAVPGLLILASIPLVALADDVLGDTMSFIVAESTVTMDWFEGRPVGIEIPPSVDLKVTETAPGLKSATVTNALKPATTETGRADAGAAFAANALQFEATLRRLNREAVDGLLAVRSAGESPTTPIVISGCIGPVCRYRAVPSSGLPGDRWRRGRVA